MSGAQAMRRREFIGLVGSAAAAWPLVLRAQQAAMPVAGFLAAGSSKGRERSLAAFLKGLNETGYVDGTNVKIHYRWPDIQYDRLQGMAADLLSHGVAAIAATSAPAGLVAKAATTTVPIVFT